MEWFKLPESVLLLVLFISFLFQARLHARARRVVTEANIENQRKKLIEDFERSISRRAVLGKGPDWFDFFESADRIFEGISDRLRTHATLALAIGLAGTLASLVAVQLTVLLMPGGSPSLEELTKETVVRTVLSLFGSLAGVWVHIRIVRKILEKSEDEHARWLAKRHQELRDYADHNGPGPLLTNELSSQLVGAFRESASGFPAALDRLTHEVSTLSVGVNKQAETLDQVLPALRGALISNQVAQEKLATWVETLAEAQKGIQNLPTTFKDLLAETGERWSRDIRTVHVEVTTHLREYTEQAAKHQEVHQKELADHTQRVALQVGDVATALSDLPDGLVRRVGELSTTLGIEFGRHARDAVNEMMAQVAADHERLQAILEGQNQVWRNGLGDVLREVLQAVSREISDTVANDLRAISSELARVAEALPAGAEKLDIARDLWKEEAEKLAQVVERVLEGLESAGNQVIEVANAQNGMLPNVQAIADNLSAIARETKTFQGNVERALVAATAAPLTEMNALITRVELEVETLHQVHRDVLVLVKATVEEMKVMRDSLDGMEPQPS